MNVKNAVLSMAGALLLFTVAPRIASTYSARSYAQQDTAEKIKTFSGTILKNGDKFVLSDRASKIDYVLDDAKKASQFEGRKVKVTGTVDVASNTIHVNEIEEIA
jgi:uncharacterized protein YdeI (BOF family)